MSQSTQTQQTSREPLKTAAPKLDRSSELTSHHATSASLITESGKVLLNWKDPLTIRSPHSCLVVKTVRNGQYDPTPGIQVDVVGKDGAAQCSISVRNGNVSVTKNIDHETFVRHFLSEERLVGKVARALARGAEPVQQKLTTECAKLFGSVSELFSVGMGGPEIARSYMVELGNGKADSSILVNRSVTPDKKPCVFLVLNHNNRRGDDTSHQTIVVSADKVSMHFGDDMASSGTMKAAIKAAHSWLEAIHTSPKRPLTFS